MAKRRGIKRLFRAPKKFVQTITGTKRVTPTASEATIIEQRGGQEMPLPAVLGSVARLAARAAPTALAALRRTRGIPGSAGSGVIFGRRRRRGGALTANEMGKITFMSQVLGKRHPALTLMVMKSLGGKL